MVGLDAAGKTTILYRLTHVQSDKYATHTLPTIGFNVETMNYKNLHFTIWDLGGQDKVRMLWKYYYQGSKGVIFVVDSNDHERIEEAAEELHRLLLAEDLRDAAVLVLANKQDLPNAMKVADITEKLRMKDDRMSGHKWLIQPTCATSGDGLFDGLDWLSQNINPK